MASVILPVENYPDRNYLGEFQLEEYPDTPVPLRDSQIPADHHTMDEISGNTWEPCQIRKATLSGVQSLAGWTENDVADEITEPAMKNDRAEPDTDLQMESRSESGANSLNQRMPPTQLLPQVVDRLAATQKWVEQGASQQEGGGNET